MKRLFLLALAIPMLFSSCMTSEVLAKAQGKQLPPRCDEEIDPDPAPLYYVMLPVSVPVDIALFPFQYFQQRELDREWAKD